MRLHTDKLTAADVHRATANLPGVFASVTEHGSRTHARALEVKLEGNGRINASSTGYGATWDEWGAVIGALYLIDPATVWGGTAARPTYADAEHFHAATGDRFRHGVLPADTHKQHRWDRVRTVTGVWISRCNRCSATMRTVDVSNGGHRAMPAGVSA